LWDLFDQPGDRDGPGSASVFEAADTLSRFDTRIFQILDKELDIYGTAPTISAFRAAWVARGLPLAGLDAIFGLNGIALPAPPNYQGWLLHTGTPLPETDNSFAFALGDYNRDGVPDLFVIKKSGTGTGSTEVHVLSGASDYQSWLLHTGTPLHETDGTFAFGVADYDGDGISDLFVIKKSGTGTGSTEVHVLSGASDYQSWLLHTGTPLHETDNSVEFALGDYDRDGMPDLFVIKKSGTGTGSTEVHVLSAAGDYQSWSLHTGTPLQETDDKFAFGVADHDGDGKADLFAIKKSSTDTASTEVHVVAG
jgi:hypothetical protein